MLSEEKQLLDELIIQLCTFERDMNKDVDSKSVQQNALVVNIPKQKYVSSKMKMSKSKEKPIGNCHYCHKAGHWIKKCRK